MNDEVLRGHGAVVFAACAGRAHGGDDCADGAGERTVAACLVASIGTQKRAPFARVQERDRGGAAGRGVECVYGRRGGRRYESADLAINDVMLEAERSSASFSEKLGVRNLDILRVASALVLGAGEFWTFDTRQDALAKAAGLKVP